MFVELEEYLKLQVCNAKFLNFLFCVFQVLLILMGYSVAQLVEGLCYNPESRGFDSRWCHWNFSLT